LKVYGTLMARIDVLAAGKMPKVASADNACRRTLRSLRFG